MEDEIKERLKRIVETHVPLPKVKGYGTVRKADGTIKIDDPVLEAKRLQEEREMNEPKES